MSIRIIGGDLRGRRMSVPDLPGLRPTTDRVRESVFNILATRIDFEDCSVLDLFAGSGALGIEALSRGAKNVLFVEKNRRALSAIGENLKEFGVAERGELLSLDAMRFLEMNRKEEKFDLIFADPPYAAPFFNNLLRTISPLLAEDGLLLLERSREIRIVDPPKLDLLLERTIGRTVIGLYRAEGEGEYIGTSDTESTAP
ncbi:MAG: 16S rRNA (guanine(966)-N(2))-methyltransferase RsmD [Candidatus Kapaibacterium sp.]